jgi:hypothetical protein
MMRKSVLLLLSTLFVTLAMASSPLPVRAETSRERVARNLDELHLWLETSKYADAWKSLVRSDALQRELARGSKADANVVASVLDRYSQPHASLRRRRFVTVRKSLQRWLAELRRPSPTELAEQARSATDAFTPPSDQELARRRALLQRAVARLDRFLARGGAKKVQAWKAYLDWEALENQLTSPPPPDIGVLRRVEKNFFGLHRGLELPVFDNVRQRLREYANAVIVADPRARGYYAGQFQQLADALESLGNTPESPALLRVGRILGLLEMGDQASALVRQSRQAYGRPNLHVRVSEEFLASGMNEQIRAQQEIRENILGSVVYSWPDMRGELKVDLAPSDERAVIDIRVEARAPAKNVAYAGPVTVYSDSVSNVEGRKRILLDDTGFRSDPARVWCETSTVINSIAARFRFVQRIAWRQAGQQKPMAEQIASRLTETRVGREIDKRTAEMLAKLNDSFKERFRWPLTRKDHLPRELRFRTSEDHLLITMLQAGTYQLGAPDDPPAVDDGADIAVRVHESYVGNLSEGLIGGETLSDVRLADLMQELTGEVPEQLQLKPENEPWSITFAGTQPIRVRLNAQQARIAVVGSRFTRGVQEINEPIEIAAVYRIEKTPQGANFTRQGEVEINFLALESLSVGQVAFKEFMQKKFNAIFKAEIVGKGIELEERWKNAGPLHLQQLVCDGGWAVLGWDAPPPDARIAELEEAGDR